MSDYKRTFGFKVNVPRVSGRAIAIPAVAAAAGVAIGWLWHSEVAQISHAHLTRQRDRAVEQREEKWRESNDLAAKNRKAEAAAAEAVAAARAWEAKASHHERRAADLERRAAACGAAVAGAADALARASDQ